MHVVDVLQEIENHLLKLFFGSVVMGGVHDKFIKPQKPRPVNWQPCPQMLPTLLE